MRYSILFSANFENVSCRCDGNGGNIDKNTSKCYYYISFDGKSRIPVCFSA